MQEDTQGPDGSFRLPEAKVHTSWEGLTARFGD
jgi:hypothetical protein